MTDADLAELWRLGSVVPTLQELQFYSCRAVTDRGLQHVAHFTALTSLDVSGTSAGGDGLSYVSWLRGLRDLKLEYTRLTDDGLARVVRLPALRSLNVVDCEQIADAQLIGLLAGESDAGKAAGAAALAVRAIEGDADWCTATALACLPLLQPLLSHASSDVAEQAAYVVSRLADNSAVACEAVMQAGCLPPLAALLASGSDQAKAHAAIAMRGVVGVGHDIAVIAASAVPLLVALLAHADEDVVDAAVRAVKCLTEDSQGANAVVAAGGIPPLVALLRHESYSAEVCYAAWAIRNVFKSELDADREQRIQQAVAAGALPALCRLLSCEFDGIAEVACDMLKALGRSTCVDRLAFPSAP